MAHHIMDVDWYGTDFTNLMTQSKTLPKLYQLIQKIPYIFITGVAATEIWASLNIPSKILTRPLNMTIKTLLFTQIGDL